MRNQVRNAVIISIISALCIFITSDRKEELKSVQLYDVFDTYCEISVSGKNSDKALEECSALLHKYHNMWNTKDENSEISKLNAAAGAEPAVLSEETVDILDKAKRYSVETNGFFDVTVGAAADLWNITEAPHVPTQDELTDVIHKTGFSILEVNKDDNTAYLTKEGAKVTLGAIAKGYATGKLVELLKGEKINSALINLGGNVYALGTQKDNKPWSVGIADPGKDGELIGTLDVFDKAVITSGSNYRYFEENGVRYHHILNPYTASPANSKLLSVTIISSDPTLADVLSTACFVIGYPQSLPLLKEYDAQAIFVTDTGTVYYSGELSDSFKHDNDGYEYKVIK